MKMTVDGQTYTQPLEVLRPPDSHGTDADLQSSVRLQLKVRDDITTVSDMTNQIEWMRKQLEDQRKTVAGKDALLKAMDAIDQKMQDVEYKLITRAEALSDDKYFQTAYKLYLNFIWLNGEIGTGAGDVAGTGDYGPTETAIGLVLDLERQLAGGAGGVQEPDGQGRAGVQQGDRRQRRGSLEDHRSASAAGAYRRPLRRRGFRPVGDSANFWGGLSV